MIASSRTAPPDAVIAGSGPNGLAAAITLAQAGWRVQVREAHPEIGGGTRTARLLEPDCWHDICSAVHPLGAASSFFRRLGLEQYGLEWIFPPVSVAHPLDGGRAVLLQRNVKETAAGLGGDEIPYRRWMEPLARRWQDILAAFLSPRPSLRNPVLATFFGLPALLPAGLLARLLFRTEAARALFAGLASHAALPLHMPGTAAFGSMLGLLGHAVGYPLARGGSHAISSVLAAVLRAHGGEILTGRRVKSLDEFPPGQTLLLDTSPRDLLAICGNQLPAGYRRALNRYRYGPGVFKMDWILDAPVPWQARECSQAATVHLGGTLAEIEASEAAAWRGETARAPFVILVQPSLFDPSRAPAGKHIVWAYCHVPNHSRVDMSAAIEAQIERFAPGFQARITARQSSDARQMQDYNPNYPGGDINNGAQTLTQLYTRPAARLDPYTTPLANVSLCSSATPPGGGVHGLCGLFAARSVLRRARQTTPPRG